MAILSYNEILQKKIITYNGSPYEVLSAHIFSMQKSKPVNQTKLRHLISKKVTEISFHQNESVEEAETERIDAIYLYTSRNESWFSEADNPKNRFSFSSDAVQDQVQWLMQNARVEVLSYEGDPVTITIPIKVDLEVKEAPPTIKGNTASGGTKPVTLVTGAKINTPLFINTGDVVRVNTDTGTYTERVTKV